MLPSVFTLLLAVAGVIAQSTTSQSNAGPAVTTSYSLSAGLVVNSDGGRAFSTVSVPIVITQAQSTTAAPASGTQSVTSPGFTMNGTVSVGGGNGTSQTQTTTTSPSTTPYAVSTLDPGGGGSGVAAPSPGAKGGSFPQGPGDGYHSASVKLAASIFGLVATVGTIVGVQLLAIA